MNDIYNSIIALRESGRYVDATELLNKILLENSGDAFAWSLLAHVYILSGDLALAGKALAKAEEIDPGLPAVAWNSARLLLKQQEFVKALEVVTSKHLLHPEDAEGLGLMGNCLRLNGRAEEGLIFLDKAINSNPSLAEAYASRGIIILSRNDAERALQDFDKALEIKPHLKELWPLVLATKQQVGDYEGASAILDLALKFEPNNLDFLLGRASISQKLCSYSEVITFLKKALEIEPRMPKVLLNLGAAYRSIGMLHQSIIAFSQAIEQDPSLAEGHYNLGNAYKQQGKLEEAIDCYLRAINSNKELSVAYSMLCEIYEKLNRLDDLSEVLTLANEQLKVLSADLFYFQALYFFRKKQFTESAKILDQIDVAGMSEANAISFYNLKGRCTDKLGNYALAFASFARMNELISGSNEYLAQDADGFFERAQARSLQLREAGSYPPMTTREENSYQANFLVGFPRSGTTLLDTILRSHSSIEVLEEKPILSQVIGMLGDAQALHKLESIEIEKINQLRAEYLKGLNKYVDSEQELTVIDKLPMNILEIPVIHRVFPQANYILAIRHPLDCILSCYMQIFKLNPAMANMMQLDRIVDMYCSLMEIMASCEARYELNVHYIHYENLVENMEEVVTGLLSFLGLGWQPELNQYQKTALERTRIATPSYSQVIQPLYKDSTYRWKNYQDQLSKYTDQLEPWLEKFGYSS